MTSWNTVPEERKKKSPFLYVCFSGGLYHRDTKFELCFIYVLYNESKFSLVKKVVSCSPAVMYSVCKPDISETPDQSQLWSPCHSSSFPDGKPTLSGYNAARGS